MKINQSWEDQCADKERNRVALMLVDPEYVDSFLEPGCEHFYCQSYWNDPKLFAMFCLICELRSAREPIGYMKKLQEHGRDLLEQRKKYDNTDSLGF